MEYAMKKQRWHEKQITSIQFQIRSTVICIHSKLTYLRLSFVSLNDKYTEISFEWD